MNVLLIGASVRAAAASLRRVGCSQVACDLFADLDLAATAATIPLPPGDYPARIWDHVRHLPPTPWLYTGAIENHPDEVERIASRHRLLGNGPAVLRAVRNPFAVAEVVRRAGLLVPTVRPTPTGIPTDGSWLEKPVASGGGAGIAVWRGDRSARSGPVVYQERIAGTSCSALFVRDAAGVRWLGATRQFHGRGANRFAYRGSLGPWTFPEPIEAQVEALGRTVGDAFGLLGIFGLDLIVAAAGAWLVEVNPRYTASVEVLERALGRSLMADHLWAFDWTPPGSGTAAAPGGIAAKAILFARSAGRLVEPIPLPHPDDPVPPVADIPRPGTWFEVGDPVLTVFGHGPTSRACRLDLARRARSWRGRLAVLRP